jgi:hypothetical protein
MMPMELIAGKFEWGPISLLQGVGLNRTADRPQNPCFPTVSYRGRSMDLDGSPPPFGGKHGSEKTRLKHKFGKPGPRGLGHVGLSGWRPLGPSFVAPRSKLSLGSCRTHSLG